MGYRTRITLLGVILTGVLVTGCGSKNADAPVVQEEHSGHAVHQQVALNGDLQEMTSGTDKLPSFLEPLDGSLKTAYSTAAGVKEILKDIPCYCGCGESAGHKSNLNCFIKEVNPDGSVVWDDHGTRCGVCVETAMTVGELSKQGKSVKEIRSIIDQTYSTGEYAAPTPTPEVN